MPYKRIKKMGLGLFMIIAMVAISAPVYAKADNEKPNKKNKNTIAEVTTVPAPTADQSTATTDQNASAPSDTQSQETIPAPTSDTNTQNTQSDTQSADPVSAPSDPSPSTSNATTSPKNDPAVTTDSTTTPQTTNPASQRENQSTKDQPNTDPTYNKNIENILNETITPTPNPATTTKKNPTPTKTPVIISDPIPHNPTTTQSTSTKKTATTTASSTSTEATSTAGTFSRTSSGGGNEVAAANYYFPLDSLSAEATYSLSALAIVLGIVGAVLIIRDPREREGIVWVPNLHQSLLEN